MLLKITDELHVVNDGDLAYEFYTKVVKLKAQAKFVDVTPFTLSTVISKMADEDLIATTLYRLPRAGKNITVLWGNEGNVEAYKKYGKGNKMSLIWKNGKFEKSTVKWSK